MKFYEKLYYKLSKRFKESTALGLLDFQLDKGANSIFRFVEYKDESYEFFNQGSKIKYEIDEITGDINVFIETTHNYKKRFIMFELRKCGNEVNIITKTPREDTQLIHIRHNSNNTVTSLSKRIKFYGREDEQTLETRYALFTDSGDLIKYDEKVIDEFSQNAYTQFQKVM